MNKTSEWVSLGHPDKTADYIASFLHDRIAERDPRARYAVECMVKWNNVYLCGEVSGSGFFSDGKVVLSAVREAVREIGYTEEYAKKWDGLCIAPEFLNVKTDVSAQSADISVGVDRDAWGDQGVFCGLAVNAPSHDYMPLDVWTARQIGMALYENHRRYGWGIDIKTQVTVDSEGEIPQVVVAVPMHGKADGTDVERFVCAKCDELMLPRPREIIVNGTGSYEVHSSIADCGLTGRKLAVDLYGMNAEIGGGSLWGKDYTKADVTLNAYARKLALDFTRRHGCACKCRISCVIGRREIEVVYTTMQNKQISRHVRESYPSLVASALGLDRPVYARICRKGMPYYVAEEC